MKNTSITLIVAFAILSSCTKKIQVKNQNGLSCSFSFPKETKITKVVGDDPSLDWLIEFSKNKKVFVSTNDVSGSPLNRYKQQELGDNIVVKIVSSDSLTLQGKNSFGNWKEVKKNSIVYGYMNIPDSEIDVFEKLIIPVCRHK